MKQCKDCLECKELIHFNKTKKSPDGLSYICRICNSKMLRQWRSRNKDKKRLSSRKYREKHPDKVIAVHRVMAALRNGSMKRGDTCFDCGKQTLDTVGDHYLGYSKEHWLDVQWICKPCDGRRRAKILELTGGLKQSVS